MFSLKFAVRYILHRFKAINRHGLHSPFVYRLVDKVIYDLADKKVYTHIENLIKPDKPLTRVDKLLYRLMADAAPETVLLAEPVNQADQVIIHQAAPQAIIQPIGNSTSRDKADVIMIDAAVQTAGLWDCFVQCLPYAHENSLVLIKNVHRHTQTHQDWQRIKAHPKVTVTVDLFWLSLVYFRKGQARENFWIRFA